MVTGHVMPRSINPTTNTRYQSSTTFIQRVDPLTLDLDGDGLETVGINPNSPIFFDHDADGVKTATTLKGSASISDPHA